MAFFRLRKDPGPHALPLAMLGVRMGERLLWIGADEAEMFAAVATKVGLSGRAAAVSRDEAGRRRLEAAAASEGVLADLEIAPGALPFEDASFDLAVLAGPKQVLEILPEAARSAWLREAFRVLRPGGRFIVIERFGGGRFLGVFPAGSGRPSGGQAACDALEGAGFRPVRLLAARAGLQFVEGLKRA